MSTRQLRAVVRGKVQGVGFRYHALRGAKQFRVLGYVRNLPDGSVEAVAAGPEDALHSFLDWLRAGPTGSRVDGVDFDWQEPSSFGPDFTIER